MNLHHQFLLKIYQGVQISVLGSPLRLRTVPRQMDNRLNELKLENEHMTKTLKSNQLRVLEDDIVLNELENRQSNKLRNDVALNRLNNNDVLLILI